MYAGRCRSFSSTDIDEPRLANWRSTSGATSLSNTNSPFTSASTAPELRMTENVVGLAMRGAASEAAADSEEAAAGA